MGDNAHYPSRSTLERSVANAIRFLRAAGTSGTIFRKLQAEGYSAAHHREGWQRVLDASGYVPQHVRSVKGAEEAARGEEEEASLRALRELDALDGPLLVRLDALLGEEHPEQAEFVLFGLQAGESVQAALNVKAVLERLEALASAPEREASRAEDAAALEVLAAFGMDEAWRARMAALLDRAQGPPPEAPLPIEPETLREAQYQVYVWYRRWSRLARLAPLMHGELVRLGLRQLRSGEQGGGEDASALDAADAA